MIAAASASLLLVLAVAVWLAPRNAIDRHTLYHLRTHNRAVLRRAHEVLTVAGSALVIALSTAVICRLAWWRWRSWQLSLLPLVAVTSSALAADHLLKPAVDRRPLAFGPAASWPSGTMASWTGLATACLVLLAIHHGRFRWQDVSGAAAALMAIAVALILTSDHYLSDVVGGWLLGVVMALTLSLGLTGIRGSGPPGDDGWRTWPRGVAPQDRTGTGRAR